MWTGSIDLRYCVECGTCISQLLAACVQDNHDITLKIWSLGSWYLENSGINKQEYRLSKIAASFRMMNLDTLWHDGKGVN